jgi:hypothetical protein
VPTGEFDLSDLEKWRQVGDPLADEAVAKLLAARDLQSVQALLNTLVLNDAPDPSELPAELKDYLDATAQIEPSMLPASALGENLFAEFGPEMLMILACYALPTTYSVDKGVHVLFRTGYLQRNANRRLFETTQMVLDVLSPGGLSPTGKGIRAAQKVRLMHAAIRTLLLQNKENPWDLEHFDVPINQEDLAGTLMAFSWLMIDGLAKIGVHLSPQEQKNYLDIWIALGKIMGIQAELLPSNMEQAAELTKQILQSQVNPSPEGRLLTQALLEMMEESSPLLFKGMPAGLMRHFLPEAVADGLAIPIHRLGEQIVVDSLHLAGLDGEFIASTSGCRILRHFNINLIQNMINVDRGGQRTKFEIPDSLQKEWHLPIVKNEGIGPRLLKWIEHDGPF